MGLETGTYINDLVITNPAVSDQEAQGANHLQLIKKVLQNTFPGASLAFPFPSTVSASINTSITAAQQNATFLVTTTGGAVTLTLPSLTSGNAGWECSVIKLTTDTNPVGVGPPSGTIQSGEYAGLSKARRCVPGARSRVLWTGTAWTIERVPRVPVGSVIMFWGASLPVGYEWPNGQTLSSIATNYPELNTIMASGITPDLRGNVAPGVDNMGGSAANRITSAGSGINGVSLGASGGAQNQIVLQANLPNVAFTVSGITLNDPQHHHGGGQANVQNEQTGTPASAVGWAGTAGNTTSASTGITVSSQGTAASGGSGTALTTMPPTFMMNYLLVAE